MNRKLKPTLKSKKDTNTVLNKAVKTINKLIQDGGIKTQVSPQAVKSEAGPRAASVSSSVKGKQSGVKSRVFRDRGVVYLAHIPHGFYENEMKAFFGQFGHVTRLRLVRSNKTGNSRGYAFVEFRFTEVAQVVAETMNNYLMRNRLLKATYIPPEKQTAKMFLHSKNYGPETCIGVINQRKAVKTQNRYLSPSETEVCVNRNKQHLIKLQEKLKAQGVDCLFQVDDGSSKRLLEETESSAPSSKKARTSSPAPKVSTQKTPSVKQSSAVPALKKPANSSKAQPNVKSNKTSKSVQEKSVKPAALKTDKKKVVEKKSDVKKIGDKKTVAKKVTAKKAVVKKTVVKKVAAKAVPAKKEATKKAPAKKQVVKRK